MRTVEVVEMVEVVAVVDCDVITESAEETVVRVKLFVAVVEFVPVQELSITPIMHVMTVSLNASNLKNHNGDVDPRTAF